VWVRKEVSLIKSLIYARKARLNKIDQSRLNLSADTNLIGIVLAAYTFALVLHLVKQTILC